jgi:hypothetical protein
MSKTRTTRKPTTAATHEPRTHGRHEWDGANLICWSPDDVYAVRVAGWQPGYMVGPTDPIGMIDLDGASPDSPF